MEETKRKARSTQLTFSVFLTVNKRVYPINHRIKPNLWNPSSLPQLSGPCGVTGGSWLLAPTRSVTQTTAHYSSTTVTLSLSLVLSRHHCFSFPHAHTSSHPRGNPPQWWAHPRQCERDSPTWAATSNTRSIYQARSWPIRLLTNNTNKNANLIPQMPPASKPTSPKPTSHNSSNPLHTSALAYSSVSCREQLNRAWMQAWNWLFFRKIKYSQLLHVNKKL